MSRHQHSNSTEKMSVFKAREWWGTRTGEGEETDGAQMAVGNIDNASDGVHKVVVGSLKGVLRIYRPSAKVVCKRENAFRVKICASKE